LQTTENNVRKRSKHKKHFCEDLTDNYSSCLKTYNVVSLRQVVQLVGIKHFEKRLLGADISWVLYFQTSLQEPRRKRKKNNFEKSEAVFCS